MTSALRLRTLARQMLHLGAIGFGGPAAHVALMRREFVERRHEFDDGEFVEMIGLTTLIPGPNSTELALHIGHRRHGMRGLFVAGFCFIAPAVVVVSILAALYAEHGAWSALPDLRAGILPVMLAIVLDAVWGLRRTAAASPLGGLVALAACGAALAGLAEFAILLVAATAGALVAHRPSRASRLMTLVVHPSLLELLWRFVAIGSVVYGSGYVLLAYLHESFVETGWISPEQLLDAVTVGQVTPGPVFTTATFLGWQFAGPAGAAVATLGIFGPSFVFVALLGRVRTWVNAHEAARSALRSVTAASLGLMAAVVVRLAEASLVDPLAVACAVVALAVMLRHEVDATWLVAAGLAVGVVRALV